ncbi:MAG: hypothetical protein ACI92E_001773 [Oceanicoccus sp.]|jgi:hypothetical protein
MPLGKSVGEFSLESTSITYQKVTHGRQLISINMEGNLTGGDENRVILGTLELDQKVEDKDGSYTWFGREFAMDGTARSVSGAGFFRNHGSNHWQLRGYIVFMDGSNVAVEAEMHLASRSLTGTLFEWN